MITVAPPASEPKVGSTAVTLGTAERVPVNLIGPRFERGGATRAAITTSKAKIAGSRFLLARVFNIGGTSSKATDRPSGAPRPLGSFPPTARTRIGPRAYSGGFGAGSGWLAGTTWWRNWTSAGGPPGSLTFFFFLGSRPCLSRPLPMSTSFYDQGQFAQEGFHVGHQADRLPASPVGELGDHRRVDVDAYGAHARGQHVAGGDRVQHC